MTKGSKVYVQEQPASDEWLRASDLSRKNILRKYGKGIVR